MAQRICIAVFLLLTFVGFAQCDTTAITQPVLSDSLNRAEYTLLAVFEGSQCIFSNTTTVLRLLTFWDAPTGFYDVDFNSDQYVNTLDLLIILSGFSGEEPNEYGFQCMGLGQMFGGGYQQQLNPYMEQVQVIFLQRTPADESAGPQGFSLNTFRLSIFDTSNKMFHYVKN